MATARAVAGGLLSGLGAGMVAQDTQRREQAERLRQEALERVRRQEDRDFQMRRDETAHQRALEREERGNEQRRGLLYRTETDAEGNLHGITQGGDVKDLGINTGRPGGLLPAGSGSGGGGDELSGITMSAEEKRAYDEVKSRYTAPNGDRVDWQAFIQHLRSMPEERGGARWNEIADYLTGSIGTNMSEAEAREQARREASSRMSVWKSREAEFPDTGGDPERWIEQRTRELMGGPPRQTTSQGGQPASDTPPAPRDRAQRVVGQVYQAPDGRLVEWTGEGWRLVER